MSASAIRVAAVFSLFHCAGIVVADEFPKHQYTEKVKEYLKSINGISLKIRMHDNFLDGGASVDEEHAIKCDQGRVISKSTTTITDVLKKNISKQIINYHLYRPDGYYIISKTDNSEFRLSSHDTTPQSILEIAGTDSPLTWFTAPLRRGRTGILSLVEGRKMPHPQEFTGYSAKMTENGLSRVFMSTGRSNDRTVYEANENFLITRCAMTSANSREKREFLIEYRVFDSRLLPSKITTSATEGDKSAKGHFDFVDYENYSYASSDFSLAQFGIPETVTQTPPPNRNFLWITLGSVAAVIVAVLVRLKIRSLEAKAS